MINTLLLLATMFVTFYAIFNLIAAIVTGKKSINNLYWFWIILCIPIVGAVLYFSINATYNQVPTEKEPRITP